jgi:hypothetical protein
VEPLLGGGAPAITAAFGAVPGAGAPPESQAHRHWRSPDLPSHRWRPLDRFLHRKFTK